MCETQRCDILKRERCEEQETGRPCLERGERRKEGETKEERYLGMCPIYCRAAEYDSAPIATGIRSNVQSFPSLLPPSTLAHGSAGYG